MVDSDRCEQDLSDEIINILFFPFRVVSQLRICRPPPPPLLRSSHLDIKDTQCAETKDVLKIAYHIISRFRVMGVQKGRYEHPKIQFSS